MQRGPGSAEGTGAASEKERKFLIPAFWSDIMEAKNGNFPMEDKVIKKGLTGNQLKLIAVIAMTLDHVGLALFPHQMLFRVIGRLAFPIYGFMISEGCVHTRSMGRYLGTMAAVAAVCQMVYFVAMDSLYQCVLVTFSLSVALIALMKRAMEKGNALNWLASGFGITLAFFITEVLPGLMKHTDFSVDYGFVGVMLPLMVYLAKGSVQKWCVCAVMLLALGMRIGGVQMWGLLALPLLVLYNGQRGKRKMKYFFYIYYPLHLVAIYGLELLL